MDEETKKNWLEDIVYGVRVEDKIKTPSTRKQIFKAPENFKSEFYIFSEEVDFDNGSYTFSEKGNFDELIGKAEKMKIITYKNSEKNCIGTIPLNFTQLVEIGRQPYVRSMWKK